MAIDTLSLDFGRDKPFCCYMYRDPRRGKARQPIYVGKGLLSSRRPDSHWIRGTSNPLFRKILANIRKAGLEPIIEILAFFDNNDDACRLEVELIARIGRRNLGKGPLANLTDGGEGIVGLIQTEEQRRKNSLSQAALWADPEIRKLRSETAKPNLDLGRFDPEVRKRAVAGITASKAALRLDPIKSKAQSEQRSALRTEAWANPVVREKYETRIRASKGSKSTKMKAHWEDPEYRTVHGANVGAATQAAWDNPVTRASRSAAIAAGKRAKAAETSATMSAVWADPVRKAQIVAKRNATIVRKRAAKLAAD